MKKIEDYLHLYLGCDGLLHVGYGKHGKQWVKSKLMGFTAHGRIICKCFDKYGTDWGYDVVALPDDFKTLLRPLSDMTEEELLEIMNVCYNEVFGSLGRFEHIELHNREGEGAGLSAWVEDWRYGLTVELAGIEFSCEGKKMSVNQIQFLPSLLSRDFDLFGLIESGFALDKTKQNPDK